MDQKLVFLTILGMGVVTYIPRLLPVLLLSTRTLPPLAITWLRYVPVAVLAAMLAPAVVTPAGSVDLSGQNLYFWAAIPTLLVAWKTRSLFGAVVTGMAIVAFVRYLG